jgi:hypothetical protein
MNYTDCIADTVSATVSRISTLKILLAMLSKSPLPPLRREHHETSLSPSI